jgi:K+-transporting ATPase A subunit
MNISTGIYRLAQIIKWFGRVVGGFWFVGVAISFLNATDRTPALKSDTILLLGSAIVFTGITEGIAWVLEGFAND